MKKCTIISSFDATADALASASAAAAASDR